LSQTVSARPSRDIGWGSKAQPSPWPRALADAAGAVIPPKADHKREIPCDFAMCRRRRLVENFFCNLRRFRRIATRHDKTDQNFSATIRLAAAAIALK
jgi:transposase